jgi:hypothetical protein
MTASLTLPTLLPSLCATLRIIRFNSMMLCAVKRVPYHVLEAWMSPVMDGRVVSRGLCFTNGNPESQPSYLAMDVAASGVHAS